MSDRVQKTITMSTQQIFFNSSLYKKAVCKDNQTSILSHPQITLVSKYDINHLHATVFLGHVALKVCWGAYRRSRRGRCWRRGYSNSEWCRRCRHWSTAPRWHWPTDTAQDPDGHGTCRLVPHQGMLSCEDRITSVFQFAFLPKLAWSDLFYME